MTGDYEFLTEKEAMWAEMLTEVLKDNSVECVTLPVFGAAMTLRGGAKERLRVYVPKESLPRAKEIYDELFSGDGTRDEAQ